MRTAAPKLLPLFRSEMQLNLLGLLLLQPDREWTLQELARALGAVPSSVHRELHRAAESGIIEGDTSARPHRYRAAERSPSYEPLRQLLETTVGVPTKLAATLREPGTVTAATIHGSFAKGRMRPGSDLDVLVVSDGPTKQLQRKARALSRELGREIDLSVISRREFISLAKQGHPFLRGILRGPRIDVIGDLEELEAAA